MVVLSEKATDPVGVPAPGSAEATAAVTVTAWPNNGVAVAVLSVIEVPHWNVMIALPLRG
ncbi:hypothetical protein ACFPFX_33660 [Streptomyces mauvecolor]|uniref:Uncharacterized protein n=1 Tax=Streptomyces mauvecolor TaxID=58345 RepID=A0ABV9UXC0_9ACTN